MRVSISDIAVVLIAGASLTMTGLAIVRYRANTSTLAARQAASAPQPVDDWSTIVAAGRRGASTSGPVRVVEFADFQCPACARAHRVLDSVATAQGRTLDITFVHFPLTAIHPKAFAAATAAECAAEQGKFRAFHDYAFQHQAEVATRPMLALAQSAGLTDSVAFLKCMKGEAAAARVRAGASIATKLGIDGTPAFIVDSMLYPAGLPLRRIIEAMPQRSVSRVTQ